MIKSILVAADASESSNRAVDVAAGIAAKYGARLNICHVIRDMQLPEELRRMAEVEHILGPRFEVLSFVANKILHAAQNRAREAGATDIRTVIAEGDPATGIINEANTLGADMIVVGTHGHSEIKEMLLGSVSRKVANLSDINCLMVR